MSDAITITKKDWHLLKLFMRHVTWGKVDRFEAWKNFVDSVESQFVESNETSQSYYEKKLARVITHAEKYMTTDAQLADFRKQVADEATDTRGTE